MEKPILIGLLGAGTVGGGVVEVLDRNKAEIAKKVGRPVQIKRILVHHLDKAPAELAKKYALTEKIDDIVNDPEISIVVELIGREHPAKDYMATALSHGKNVVTANKDVLAKYGKELFGLAEEHHVDFMFEAAVGGGIPIISPLKSCLAANKITSILGIINGTTNYMLTKMSQENMSYAEALAAAQKKGYAESDPTADVGGMDAARKIAILASIGFNTRIGLEDVYVEGIDSIELNDIQYANDLGYVIKLLGVAKNDPKFGVSACVYPVMLPRKHPLAAINGAFNAIFVTGDAVGDAMFVGLGAGRYPTASAVCGDIIDVARNINFNATGRINCTCFEEKHLCDPKNIVSPCYIRLHVEDRPGALATIATVFATHEISLKNIIQKGVLGKNLAELVVITYDVSELSLHKALETLETLPNVHKICSVVRVEDKDFD
jgi:homoserine dehydrogenase